MKVALTGADGFLGWHTRVRLHYLTDHEVVDVTQADWPRLAELVAGCDAVVHIAGINRDSDDVVEQGNIALATELVQALDATGATPRIVYSNTIHSTSDTPYGRGKTGAADTLRGACARWGTDFVDVSFPNLFGEHGRPAYNSFVATFAHAVANGEAPATVQDRQIELLHVQDAAQALIDGLTVPAGILRPRGVDTSVQSVLDKLVAFREIYRTGEIPSLATVFDINLFNTLRAALWPANAPISLTPRSDPRGRLVETIRQHGGQGQTFVSTTVPGITRGEHFHLHKVERFVVLVGQARISLRKVLTDEVIHFDVTGDEPVAIDMPTLWTHNITNTGDTEITTVFWTNELFDPNNPDTHPEPVLPKES